jgi:uncharacterized membrane protein
MKQKAKTLFRDQYSTTLLAVLLTLLISVGAGSVLPLIGAVLIAPIFVGRSRVFLDIARGKKGNIDNLLEPFKDEQYADRMLVLFLKALYQFLWFLLLIVPGIVKTLSYAMVPYILAEDGVDVKNTDAITMSREMMDGHKMRLFMLYLSFIGWYILGALTLGILTVLYVEPYVQQTLALFYDDIKTPKQQVLDTE